MLANIVDSFLCNQPGALSFQLLQAQEKINSLQSNSQPTVKKEKKQKPKPKVIDDLCDDEPSPVIQTISKPPPPPPMPAVEEIPIAVAAVAEQPLPKPAKPAKAKPLSHKKTAQKPVTSVAVVDIPDPVPPAPQAAPAGEPDFRQDLKRLATLLPQLPGLIIVM